MQLSEHLATETAIYHGIKIDRQKNTTKIEREKYLRRVSPQALPRARLALSTNHHQISIDYTGEAKEKKATWLLLAKFCIGFVIIITRNTAVIIIQSWASKQSSE